jgi:hypothetical protein
MPAPTPLFKHVLCRYGDMVTLTFDRTPRLLARALLFCMAAVFLFASTLSMAAEYDPAQCPDAQAAEASIHVVADLPAQGVLKSAKLLPRLNCTVCCQSPCAEAEADMTVAAPAPLHDTPHVAAMQARAPDTNADRLLRPPRA